MASTLVGRLVSFSVGFGVAALLGARSVYVESRQALATMELATKALSARIAALEEEGKK